MLTRFGYPVLLSVAGLLFFLLPFTSANRAFEKAEKENYIGSNSFFCHVNNIEFDQNTSVQAEVAHTNNLFYLNLWIGDGRENRITFVLKDEDLKETAYELDHPSKRYLSFLYHGQDCTYSSDEYYTGILMIHKYDTANKIIAGSFEFMAHSDDCNKLVRVRDGKFDATYASNQLY
jgi:hypothetical protein